jgi:hypothetical protein
MATQGGAADPAEAATSLTTKHASAQAANAGQPLHRRRALRVLTALAAAAAGAAVVSAIRLEEASAYVQTEPSTQFTGPIASNGGNGNTPLGATIVGTNPNSGYAIYGTTNAGGITAAIYGLSTGEGTGVFGECDNGIAAVGVQGRSETGTGVLASGVVYGVWAQAQTAGAFGVFGQNSGGGIGIYGQSTHGSNSTNVGVYGEASGSSSGFGVVGYNPSGGVGVYGQATGSSSGFAVIGNNMSGGVGVYGQTSGPNPAIQGFNPGTGPGLQGFNSGGGIGLQGTATGSAPGVQGYNSGSGPGLVGQSVSGLAGLFAGPVTVTGALTVLGPKSAAVRGADGGLKRLYSLESPESWFEDFGSGHLTDGSATVQLEPGFAGVVHGDDYHAFLTPRGESKGWLYVSKQNPNGFTVQEAGGGTSNIGFSYRVVAKRKDIAGTRLEHVEEPPTPPLAPTAPATPPAIDLPKEQPAKRGG